MSIDFAKLASNVWRDYVTDGVPGSGAHPPDKADIRAWGAKVEASLGTVPLWLTNIGGTGNVVTADSSPEVAAYATGQTFFYVPTAVNTGAVTVNLNGIGALAAVDPAGAALGGGEFIVGRLFPLAYNGTHLRLVEWPVLVGTATYDPGSLVDGAGETTTVTVTGAALGDHAEASFSNALQGILLTAWVSATDTVSVRFQNESGGVLDLASGTLRARIRRG